MDPGPLFIVLGLFWLGTIPFTDGILVIRWIVGIGFLISGTLGTISYYRDRRAKTELERQRILHQPAP